MTDPLAVFRRVMDAYYPRPSAPSDQPHTLPPLREASTEIDAVLGSGTPNGDVKSAIVEHLEQSVTGEEPDAGVT
ncbi:hypothetical protein [Demequina sp.]|uniref:hypothetical protein n=1 Tax=Demequina sp. TaxID=2050685 RepID=UPI003D0B4D98